MSEPAGFRCAYAIDAARDHGGFSCASSPDFCFFCSFEPDAVATAEADGSPGGSGDGENDLYSSLVDLVNDLTGQKKELDLIVGVVASVYARTVQPHITWETPAGGAVKAPEWGKASIRRHILHSRQFAGLFPSVVRGMFHSIICKQNATMVDEETGMVVEETRKAFIDTADAYRKWETWAASMAAGNDGRPTKRGRGA